MNKLIFAGLALCLGAFALVSFVAPTNTSTTVEKEQINWITWEEAIEQSETNPKKIFIDVYTDWCGWCKKMDKTTFVDEQVAKLINENFYAVKFNAEQKEDIEYNGHVLKYQSAGRRGIHELAYSLLDGRASYPSYVYLDEQQRRITISPGYKYVQPFIKELKYIVGDHFQKIPFSEFSGE